jgi:hypothetical protein
MTAVVNSSSSDDFVDEIVSHAAVDFLDSNDDGVKEPGGSRLGRIKSRPRARETAEDTLFRD